MKKKTLLILFLLLISTTVLIAGSGDYHAKEGNPQVLSQSGKIACIDFDYSNLNIIQIEDKEALSVPFEEWVNLYAREVDVDDWMNKFPDERKELEEKFVKEFNKETKKGVKIRNNFKKHNYKIIVHVQSIYWGDKKPNYGGGAGVAKALLFGGFGAMTGSCTWEVEVINLENNKCETIIECSAFGSGFTTMKMLNQCYSDIAEELPDI